MLAKNLGATLYGVTAIPITIEVDAHQGLPGEVIVGLPDLVVRESKIRIRSAIKQSGFQYPLRSYTINLAPADIKKEGPLLDFPIAMGMLQSTGQLPADDDSLFVGELALGGQIRPVRGIVSICDMARKQHYRRVFVPLANYQEASLIRNLTIIPIKTLADMTDVYNDKCPIPPVVMPRQDRVSIGLDYKDVKGQVMGKRACEIAAAGRHNLLFVGSPGSGKTMLAKRFSSILPPLTHDELIDTYKLMTISQKKGGGIVGSNRPFRSPHHTISYAGMVGGGVSPLPGEISLAHHGILFLDELPEFHRNVLEVLRQPLEDQKVTLCRANFTVEYPAKFILLAAMNPCPCGYWGDKIQPCRCNPLKRDGYQQKISGPLLDRIDLICDIPRPHKSDLLTQNTQDALDSKTLYARVKRAMAIQKQRNPNNKLNADLTPHDCDKLCRLPQEAKDFLGNVLDQGLLTGRSYIKLLRVARTLADLNQDDSIQLRHITEALQFRCSWQANA